MRHFLTTEEEAEVVAAIRDFELHSSVELRVCVSYRKPWKPEKLAWKVFEKLGMRATRDRNAVLICVLPKRRKFVVIGDTGVDEIVSAPFWNHVAAEMAACFREEHPGAGIVRGIALLKERLSALWPASGDDVNELPNEIAQER
ncbi:MAG: TPM domain-containing protein [Verrucomicrobiota bacterium]